MKELQQKLEEHQTVYTPYLGTSSMIANFSYVDTSEYQTKNSDSNPVEIYSIIPYKNRIPDIVIEENKVYAIEQDLPLKINEQRDLLSSYSVIYNPKKETISLRNIEYNNTSFTDEYGTERQENFLFISD